MPAVRIRCANGRCGKESIRYFANEKFDRMLEGKLGKIPCDNCGFRDTSYIITNSRVKDGFTPGWQENIRAFAATKGQYDALLKERGLVEIGYDYTPQESVLDHSPCANLDFAMELKKIDPKTSDREMDAIISGKYFKD